MQSCDCAESSRTNTGGSRCQDCHPRRAPAPLVAAGVSAAISVRCALFTSPSCGPRCEEEGSIFIARHSWNWKRGKEHEDENKEIEGEVMRFLPLSLSSISLDCRQTGLYGRSFPRRNRARLIPGATGASIYIWAFWALSAPITDLTDLFLF